MIRRLSLLLLLLTVPRIASAQLWSSVLDADRGIDWSTPGVSGGIPTTRTQCGSTIAAYTGTAATINNALAACGANQYVHLGTGTFSLSTSINIDNYHNLSLKGDGANLTLLTFSNISASVCGGYSTALCVENSEVNYPGGPVHTANWTAGYTAGTTTITLSSVTGLSTGMLLFLDQDNDGADTGAIWVCETAGSCSGEGSAGTSRAGKIQSQTVVVTNVAGSSVTFTPGLYMENWSSGKNPGAWWGNTTETGVGIEDLSITHSTSCPSGTCYGITFFNVKDSWLKGVRSVNSPRNHVFLPMTARITIRDSYFQEGQTHTSQSYGVETQEASNLLIENNIFQKVSNPWIGNGQCNGCVIAYNYMVNDRYFTSGCPETCTWMQHGLQSHAWTDFQLFEGNDAPGFNEDGVHASHALNTAFRNNLEGWETGKTDQTNAFILTVHTRCDNLLANVLGHQGYHTTYQSTTGFSNPTALIWALSARDTGQSGSGSDANTNGCLYRYGNWDSVTSTNETSTNDTAGIKWDAAEVPSGIGGGLAAYAQTEPASHTMPSSFYLSGKPSWFGSVPFPPIGPDVTSGDISNKGGHAYRIPARKCFEDTMGGSASSGLLTFNANTCYSGSGAPVYRLRFRL